MEIWSVLNVGYYCDGREYAQQDAFKEAVLILREQSEYEHVRCLR